MTFPNLSNLGSRAGGIRQSPFTPKRNGDDLPVLTTNEELLTEASKKESSEMNQVDFIFRALLFMLSKEVVFNVFGTLVHLTFLGEDITYEVQRLPHNRMVWLCRQGIAVGRIPKYMDPEKALCHRNRVTLVPWWEALWSIDPVTREDISLKPESPFSPEVTPSRLAQWYWNRYSSGMDFFPWKDITPGIEQVQCFQELEDLIEYLESRPVDEHSEVARPKLSDSNGFDEGSPGHLAHATQKRIEYTREQVAFWGRYAEGFMPEQLEPPPITRDPVTYLPTRKLANEIRRCMDEAVDEVSRAILSGTYLMDPQKGFKPVEGLPLAELLRFMMVGLNNQSAETAVCTHFVGRPDITPDVVLKVRRQIRADAVQALFRTFTDKLMNASALKDQWIRFGGYLVLGLDGTDINLLRNDQDEESSCAYSTKGARPYNQLHCTTCYDIFNGINYDYRLTSKKKTQERAALLDMLDTIQRLERPLIVADRGFESWEVLAGLCLRDQKFVIRLKDANSNGIMSGFQLEGKGDEFQVFADVTLCKKEPVDREPGTSYQKGNYSFLDGPDDTCRIKLRFYQFRLPNGKLECLVTNVPTWELSAEDLAVLYFRRWGVETSYRNIKYYMNTCFFHSVDPEYARQELHAKMTMYNFSSFLIRHVEVPGPRRKLVRKYEYAIKISRGTALCAQFFKHQIDADVLAASIIQRLQPIRPGRIFPRNVKPQSAKSSLYRGIGA